MLLAAVAGCWKLMTLQLLLLIESSNDRRNTLSIASSTVILINRKALMLPGVCSSLLLLLHSPAAEISVPAQSPAATEATNKLRIDIGTVADRFAGPGGMLFEQPSSAGAPRPSKLCHHSF